LKVSIQEKGSFKRILTIEVDPEGVTEKFEETLQNYKKTVKMPGFRPGKIPKPVLLQRFGKAFREEAVEKVVNESFQRACKEKDLVPITRPVINNIEDKKGLPLVFEAEVEIDPPVEIKKYQDLKIKIEEKTVSADAVQKVLKDLQEQMATLNPVNRTVKLGDFADLEYKKVVIDGEERKGFESPKYPVEVGGSPLKAMEKGMVGMEKGQEKTIDFTFPKDYQVAELAGKKAVFTVLVNGVKEKILPALNDEFAKDAHAQAKTLEGLKQKIGENLKSEQRRAALSQAYEKAIDKIIEKNPFDVPDSRVTNYLSISYQDYSRQTMEANRIPQNEFEEKNRAHVVRDLKRYKILESVARNENIKALPAEVDEEIERFAKARGESPEKVKTDLKRNGKILNIRDNIKDQKTLDFLVGNLPAKSPTS